ncbi:unnamed protein product [Prunus armeniaca]|uniref:TOD1/MUCI70 glycosyltransferase-like domain-containing protein n=1 Tax=Prunus armeniaca TaxID=36596 RepID=A0A6J5W5V0_PRUAR|nr:unnamed protein product [Prunus armeniaca]
MALALFVKEEGWVDLSDTNSGSRVFLFAAIFLIYLLLFGLNMHFAVEYLVEPKEVMNFTLFSLEFIDQEEEGIPSRRPPGFSSTGFDIDAKDKAYKNECKIAVSSCIFGSSDFLRRPTSKKDCERRALVKLFRHREEPSPPGPPPFGKKPLVLFTKFIKVYERPYAVYAGMETEVKTKLMSAACLARLNGLTHCRLVAAAEPE